MWFILLLYLKGLVALEEDDYEEYTLSGMEILEKKNSSAESTRII